MPESLVNTNFVLDPRGVRRRQRRRETIKAPIDELLVRYFDRGLSFADFQHGKFFDLEGLAIYVNSASLRAEVKSGLPILVEILRASSGPTAGPSFEELVRQSVLARILEHLIGYPVAVQIEGAATMVVRPAV